MHAAGDRGDPAFPWYQSDEWAGTVDLPRVSDEADARLVTAELRRAARRLAAEGYDAVAGGFKPYSLYVSDAWLRVLFAEVNLTRPGVPDAEAARWHDLLEARPTLSPPRNGPV